MQQAVRSRYSRSRRTAKRGAGRAHGTNLEGVGSDQSLKAELASERSSGLFPAGVRVVLRSAELQPAGQQTGASHQQNRGAEPNLPM